MPLDPSRIRLICFDVDGTLNDTDDQYMRRFIPLVRPLAWAFKLDPQPVARALVFWLESPGTFLLLALDALRLDGAANWFSERLDIFLAKRRTPTYLPIEGVDEMLQALQPVYRLAVVSARGKRKTMAFLNYCNLTGFFADIATGQTCSRTKPHPDPILWAAGRAGVDPEQCLMVGDTPVDIRAGKAAGAQTVGVLCGFGQEAELRRAGADLILPRTTDLLKIIIR